TGKVLPARQVSGAVATGGAPVEGRAPGGWCGPASEWRSRGKSATRATTRAVTPAANVTIPRGTARRNRGGLAVVGRACRGGGGGALARGGVSAATGVNGCLSSNGRSALASSPAV